MSAGELLMWCALVLIGIAGQALCGGAEMGTYALNRVRLSIRAEKPGRARMLKHELDDQPRLLACLLIGFNFFGFIGAAALTTLLQHLHWADIEIVLLNVLLVGPVMFVITDALPKELFRARPDGLSYALVPLLVGLRWVLQVTGVLWMVQTLARLCARLLPRGEEAEALHARERIGVLLKEGARHGTISESQVSLLDRALALRETDVGDEMIPWNRCAVVPASATRQQALELSSRYGFSRFPIVDASGTVIGIVDLLDICLYPERSVRDLSRPALLIEPSLPIRDALRRLRDAGVRMAIVTSRGRPVGLVTTKDLVEPLTGELKAW
jgi:CBS domain containing-hemolysin-like protein